MEISYEQVLARLNAAKSNFNNGGQTSADFVALGKEFNSIAQAFKALPSSHVVKAQIEVCENYRKVCEENSVIRQNEEYQQNHRSALARLSTAKQKLNAKKQSQEDFTALGNEFAAIEQIIRALPSSFDVKAQIEECEECRKLCEVKGQAKKEKEQRNEAAKKDAKKNTGIVVGAIIGGVAGLFLSGIMRLATGIIFVIPCAIIGIIGALGGKKGAKCGGITGVIIGVISIFGFFSLGPRFYYLFGTSFFDLLTGGPFLLLMPIIFGICGLIIGAISGTLSRAIRG